MMQSLNTFAKNIACVLVTFVAFTHSYAQDTISVSRGMSNEQTNHELIGKASFYGDEFHGRKAANGEIFDNTQMTAAHKTLPFGTVVKVIRKDNGKSITVRIIDRGPFKVGRIIDLSQAAAIPIGLVRDGVTEVTVEIISAPFPIIATSKPVIAANTQVVIHDKPNIVTKDKLIKSISTPQDDYGIQVGAFSDIKTAERATTKLVQKGISNLVIHTGTSSNQTTVFRVIVGPFEKKEEAQKAYEMLVGNETSGLVIDMNNLR